MKRRTFLATLPGLTFWAGCKKADTGPLKTLRFGHFPNVTHVQGLVAHQLSRQGKGWFEKRLGLDVQWFTYNAGPSAMEAIFAGALDVTYAGPSPVLNAYSKSRGTELRVLAGAANGGNALVVRPDSGISKPEDFRGKKIASPQLGNTQDVQLRAYLADHGIKVTLTGGDAYVIPTQNADQLGLFQRKEIDAVWTAEPWVTRLEQDGGGKIFLEDKDTNITLLASSVALIKNHADVAQKVKAAHEELTQWIKDHEAESYDLIKAELTELTKAAPKDDLLKKALSRVVLTNEISHDSLERMVASAKKVGFLTDIPDLGNLLPKL